MAQKKRNTRYVTAAGTAIYPYLTKPDTQFNPDGEYKVKLKLSPDAELKDSKGESRGTLQEFLDAMTGKSVAKAKQENPKKRIKEADAPYTFDEDDGSLLVNFKLKAKVKTKDGSEFEQAVALFDAKGKPFDGDEIWGGSTVKVSFEVVPFYTAMIGAGLTLRLKAAQIIELKKGGEQSADSFGFGEEDGYESTGQAQAEEAGFATDDDLDDDDIPFDVAGDNDGDF